MNLILKAGLGYNSRMFCGLVLGLVLGGAQLAARGGGPLYGDQAGDCITPAERIRVQADVARYENFAGRGRLTPAAEPYRFFPQGGNLWRDLFVNNFADMDPTAAHKDWDCTNFTYNGHQGHDVDLRSFGEQSIGVPIFAALDGVVVSRADGNFDMNTAATGQPANYVVVRHTGTHYTYYWHMRNGSVAVQVGDVVRAGQQLGMTASSGNSTGPHLHFETWYESQWVEPSAGACNPGRSNWVSQTPIRRDAYLRDLNVTSALLENYQGLPYDMPRTGTFVAGVRGVSWWMNLHNVSAMATWRVQFFRPNGTSVFDSGTQSLNNAGGYRWSWWWWRYNLNLDTVGTWKVRVTMGGVETEAPFRVVAGEGDRTNLPPNPVSGFLDPPNPKPGEVVFCRVSTDLVLDDPDYDIVRYRYRWYRNGVLVRDVITAGQADALPGTRLGTQNLQCRVDVGDGTTWVRGFVATPSSRGGRDF